MELRIRTGTWGDLHKGPGVAGGHRETGSGAGSGACCGRREGRPPGGSVLGLARQGGKDEPQAGAV